MLRFNEFLDIFSFPKLAVVATETVMHDEGQGLEVLEEVERVPETYIDTRGSGNSIST